MSYTYESPNFEGVRNSPVKPPFGSAKDDDPSSKRLKDTLFGSWKPKETARNPHEAQSTTSYNLMINWQTTNLTSANL